MSTPKSKWFGCGCTLKVSYEIYQSVSGGYEVQNFAAYNFSNVKLNFDPLLKHYHPPNVTFKVRLLTQIFSLYVILLALVPCQDNFSLVPNDAPAYVHAEDPEHEHPTPEHEDHCTPFCICACCGAVLDAPPKLFILEEVLPLPPKGSTQPNAVQNWNSGIFTNDSWEPPKYL